MFNTKNFNSSVNIYEWLSHRTLEKIGVQHAGSYDVEMRNPSSPVPGKTYNICTLSWEIYSFSKRSVKL